MPTFPTTYAGKQAAALHQQTTTGHAKQPQTSSGPSYKTTPSSDCDQPTTEQKEAENKLVEAWKKDHLEKYNEMLKTHSRHWAPSTCMYKWYPNASNYTPEGGKRRRSRKTKKNRKTKSHKRR